MALLLAGGAQGPKPDWPGGKRLGVVVESTFNLGVILTNVGAKTEGHQWMWWGAPPSLSSYLRQQQDPLLKPPGQGLVCLPLPPLLQQLAADLPDLLLELLPGLLQPPGTAGGRQKGRASGLAHREPPHPPPGPLPPGCSSLRAQNRDARVPSSLSLPHF